MNIVYGVSGEGLGHVYEAIQVIRRLTQEGHSVKAVTYGDRACRSLAEFKPTRIEGVHLYFDPDGMSLRQTVGRNLRIFPYFFRNWSRLMRELKAFEPDVFITAYEPFSMVASHFMRKPLISMDNQNEILYTKAPPGTSLPALWLVKLATRVCTFGARYYIIKSLTKPCDDGPRTRFVSPIVQDEIRAVVPTLGNHVLVYLTKPNLDLIEVLKSIDQNFIVYGHPVGELGNITFRSQGPNYVRDLGSCKAIIATAGFSLIADSIFLKKPYFGAPLRGQFEQTYNAHLISQLGIGEFSEFITKADLERFLGNLAGYRATLEHYHLDPEEQVETLLGLLREIGSKYESPLKREPKVRRQ
jgi:uncharacterized protein (TIGR00661 family)